MAGSQRVLGIDPAPVPGAVAPASDEQRGEGSAGQLGAASRDQYRSQIVSPLGELRRDSFTGPQPRRDDRCRRDDLTGASSVGLGAAPVRDLVSAKRPAWGPIRLTGLPAWRWRRKRVARHDMGDKIMKGSGVVKG
jgi:hypothetical protein